MGFTIIDHTGDVGAAVTATSLPGLFADAARALMEVICCSIGSGSGPQPRMAITLRAPSLEELMVTWLSEVLYQFEVHDRLLTSADVRVSEDDTVGWQLGATASFDPFDPDRHQIKVLVKAITYHALDVREASPGEWVARVIFDI